METAEQRIQTSIDFLTKLHELLKEYNVDITPEMSNGYTSHVRGMEFDFPVHGVTISNDYIDADNVLTETIRLKLVKEQEYG